MSFSTNQTFSLKKPLDRISDRSLLFLVSFLVANLIKQCAVLTLNWILLTDFCSTGLHPRCVTNSMWIVHLYLWFHHYDRIPHQGDLKLTEGNEGAVEAACPPRLASMASVPLAVCVQLVTLTVVDTNKT